MKLAVLGGTGKSGRHLVEQALAAGHQVVVLTRNAGKLGIDHEQLSVVQGDVQDAARVSEAIAGADAVLSVLGPTSNQPTYEVSRGMENVLAAMREQGVRRLIQTLGAGVADPNDRPGLLDRAITALLKLTARYVYEDMLRVARCIRATDLDWTLVRVPMLTDDPPRGDVRVGYVGQGIGPRVSRADVAAFVLRQVSDDTYVRQAPAISN
ncbi:MAG TPA: SDR family oxidoreductase [Anaerolineae bacterium]|nr:SDR family oxidoreductase [Anaerolineae bacterium]